jgi:protein-S-isoprenylcysteine O-methyltransferase Ste14
MLSDNSYSDTKSTQQGNKGAVLRAVYSLFCYGATLASLICYIVFVSDVCPYFSANSSAGDGSIFAAVTINVLLLTLFGVQHSIMARQKFKCWIQQYIDPSVERATYCLATALVLLTMVFGWQGIPGTVWNVDSEYTVFLLRVIGVIGWVILLLATFQLDHFELFGLRQTFSQLVGKPIPKARFKTPGLYRIVRHPIQLGVLIGTWAVPAATLGHIFFAVGISIYILIGLFFEERDLIKEFGNDYRIYTKRVAKLIPFFKYL